QNTLIRCAVTKERNRDLVASEHRVCERCASRDRNPATDDSVHTQDAEREVEDVHRATLSLAIARSASEQLRHHPFDVGALRNEVAMAAVSARDPVAVSKNRAGADRDRLLANVEMNKPRQLPELEQLLHLLLKGPNPNHALVQRKRELC